MSGNGATALNLAELLNTHVYYWLYTYVYTLLVSFGLP